MKLLTFTSLYPNAAQPRHGIFVENRLRHLVAGGAVESRVIAPVPWFPLKSKRFGRYGTFARVPRRENRHGLDLYHPRFFSTPRIDAGLVEGGLSATLMARGAMARLRGLIAEGYDFDLIDAHYFYPDGVAAALLARALNKPLVITARGSDVNLFAALPGPRRRILWAADKAAHIIAVSAALKARLCEAGVPEEKVSVIRNGVDLALFAPRDRRAARRALGLERPTLLMVGNLVALKGHRLVLEALAGLPGWDLLIVGTGPARGALERQTEALGLGGRVRFLGAVAHEALPDIYNAADLLVLASSREGIANVLLEAMACGTPVVSTAVGGCPEVVLPGGGVVLPERSAEALQAALRGFPTQPCRRAGQRTEVREKAMNFGWETASRTQEALLKDLRSRFFAPASSSFNLHGGSSLLSAREQAKSAFGHPVSAGKNDGLSHV